jgi:hypothetical protein
MDAQRPVRILTTPEEREVLSTFINEFFERLERSKGRDEVVRRVCDVLRAANHRWTPRSIRIWFNNNRRRYVAEPSPTPLIPVAIPLDALLSWSAARGVPLLAAVCSAAASAARLRPGASGLPTAPRRVTRAGRRAAGGRGLVAVPAAVVAWAAMVAARTVVASRTVAVRTRARVRLLLALYQRL